MAAAEKVVNDRIDESRNNKPLFKRILSIYGDRFTLKTLKDFGFGKQGMEQIILEEVALFKIFIAKYVGKPVDISSKMNLPILNSLWRVTVGERFDYDDQRLLDICHRLTEGFKVFVSTKQNFVYSFPWIMKIPFASKLFDFQLVTRVVNDIVDLMQENIRNSAANRLIGEVVQSRRRPLLGPSPG